MKQFLFILICAVAMISCSNREKHYKVVSASILWPSTNKHIVHLDSMYHKGDTVHIEGMNGELGSTFVIVEESK